jgi:hypothetical protein
MTSIYCDTVNPFRVFQSRSSKQKHVYIKWHYFLFQMQIAVKLIQEFIGSLAIKLRSTEIGKYLVFTLAHLIDGSICLFELEISLSI